MSNGPENATRRDDAERGEELYDDRVRPLLLAQADKRGAADWCDEDAEQVIAALLAQLDAALAPAPQTVAEEGKDG